MLQIFIELPKFAETFDCVTPQSPFLEQFAAMMKHLAECNDVPESIERATFEKFFKAAELGSYNEQEKTSYKQSVMNDIEYWATLADYKEEGQKEGIKKGELSMARKTAVAMLKDGKPLDEIARYTDLSAEEINKIGHIAAPNI